VEAAAALTAVLESPTPSSAALALQHFVEHEVIAEAGRRGWPVCVHTGLWAGTWADFRLVHPENLIAVALRHRETRFDVYHAGVPLVSTVGIMARQAPNLWLNLCWMHVISPVLARRALDEWLDVVPTNKLIAWGGDYWMALEKVYGHLVMARENIAEVLADRICRGLISEAEALAVAGRMFRDNPAALYNLPPRGGPSVS
jgi:predicted TIM-barrel fold metal-dependent hydrolase